MKISVITATYNSAATVEQTLLSVIGQTHKDVEYIIVDGGSTDGTMKILEKYRSKISKIISGTDNGIYDALNKGIKLASSEWIAFLHSDDIYCDNNILHNYIKVIQTEKCDAVYADLYYVDSKNPEKVFRKWKSARYQHGDFLMGWMPPHPTFISKRELYEKYGYFREDFHSAADYELMLRFVHKHKIKLSYLDKYTVKMRVGGESNKNIKNRFVANLDDRRAWEVNGLKPKWYTLWLKPLKKIRQFF